MFALRGKGRPLPPLSLAVPHAIVVVAAGAALLAALKGQTVPAVTLVALGGFLLATLVGTAFFLFSHLRRKPSSSPLMYVHATVAAISFAMFLFSIFSVV